MFVQELAPALEALIFRLHFLQPDHSSNALRQRCRERCVCDGIFERPLRISGNETYCRVWRGIERMREGDFAGFQALFVDDVFFCGEG